MPIEHRRLVIKWRRHVLVLGACFAVVLGMRMYLQQAMRAAQSAALNAEETTAPVATTTLPEPGQTIARP